MVSENVETPQSLADLIGNTPYQIASNDPSHGTQETNDAGVARQADNPDGRGTEEGLSPAVGTTSTGDHGNTEQQGVTTPDSPGTVDRSAQPDPREAEIARLTETINNQSRVIQQTAMTLQQREEAAFRQSLQDMDPEERERAIEKRELQRLRTFAQQQQQQTQQQRQMTQQQAKNLVALMTAADHGLPASAQQILSGATSPEHMAQMAQNLVNQGYGRAATQQGQPDQQQQAQAQQQQQQVRNERGQFVNQQQAQEINPAHIGGGESGSSDVTPKVEYGSGDLMGYIQGAQWTIQSSE